MLLFTQFLATRAAVGPLLIRITHITSPFLNEEVRGGRVTSSKVQGLSVGSWETARWKFQALIETPFGSESRQTISKWFDKFQLVIGPKKILCIIVPNRRTAPLESLLFVFCLLFRLCLKTLVLPLLPNRLYPNMCPITVKTAYKNLEFFRSGWTGSYILGWFFTISVD